MSTACSKRGCENQTFQEDKYCILHCDKKDFKDEDVNLFWRKFREIYPYNSRDELVIENIKFPKFQVSIYFNRGYLHSESGIAYNQNINFKNCIFYSDFRADFDRFNSEIIFDNCKFRGDIKVFSVNKMQLINNEFKNEFELNNTNIQNLEIKSTKFIKDCYIRVGKSIMLDDTSIFRQDAKFQSNSLKCLNSKFDRELSIDCPQTVEIDNLTLKSDVRLSQNQNTILKDTIFQKSLTVDNIMNIEIDNAEFKNDVSFLSAYNNINISNSIFQKFNCNTTHTLNINGSNFTDIELNGDSYEKVNFENVRISNSLELSNVTEVSLVSIFSNSIKSNGENCKRFFINHFTASNLLLESQKYDEVKVETGWQETDIKFNSSVIKNVFIESIKSTLLNIEVKKAEEIFINFSTIKKVILRIDESELIKFSNSSIYKLIDIESEISKDFVFEKNLLLSTVKINYDKVENINILESNLENIYINARQNLDKSMATLGSAFIESSTIENDFFTNSLSKLEIKGSNLNGCLNSSYLTALNILNTTLNKTDIIEGKFDSINIENSFFNGKFLLSKAKLTTLNIEAKNERNIFNELVDMESSNINNMKIDNSSFETELNLKNISISLDKINNVFFEKLNICKSTINTPFHGSKDIKINQLILDKVKLDSLDENTDIDINNIEIDEFKCNKLSISQDMNLDDAKIDKFRISNSNIEKVFRIRYSYIKDTFFTDTTFEDLQIIDNKNEEFKEKREFRLRNTTIKSTVLDKLRLDSFNMSDAHVSDAKIGYVKFQNGSRETNRFFKNYYDSISDYIKANKYYKDEMLEQYKVSKGSEKIVLFFNKWISNFGQSWLWPLFWILAGTLIFYRLANFDLLSLDGFRENHIGWMINDILKFSNPFSKKTNVDYHMFYWAWFFHKIFMTVFIYHFVVAVKRKTKR